MTFLQPPGQTPQCGGEVIFSASHDQQILTSSLGTCLIVNKCPQSGCCFLKQTNVGGEKLALFSCFGALGKDYV